MQLHALVFAGVQAAVTAYALREGGQPERVAAGLMVTAALATFATPVAPLMSFRHFEWLRFVIDGLLLAGLVAVAARADRFWPMWIAALQLLAMGVHGVRAYDAAVLPIVYAKLTGWTAYPMFVLLVAGVRRHRLRVAGRGPERSWSPAW